MSRKPQHLVGAATALAALGMALVAVLLASGQIAFVSTHGVSMNPVYHQGDLVVVSRAADYSPGDIAAYHLASGEVALHRIIGADADGFTFKGDNNESVDIDHPRADELIGRALFHIPHGGQVLQMLTAPPMLALASLALLAGTAPTLSRRRRRRAARKDAMPSHVASQKARATLHAMLQAPLRAWTAAALAAGVLAVGLGAWAWAGPAQAPAPAGSDARMDFSYSADVPRTPAYDGTSITSPDPVFRRVTDTLDVHYTYRGPSGSITPVAEVSTPGGWHTTVPLGGPADVPSGAHQGTATLDFAALEARANKAAKVTGLPASPITVEVVPTVTGNGHAFKPALKLLVTPLQVSPVDRAALSITSGGGESNATPRALPLGQWQFTAGAARIAAPILLLAALAALIVLSGTAHRRRSSGEAEAIRRRWPSLVVPVHPIPMASGRPVIDVLDFPTLAKLAERYGLLVLHWTRSDVETFIVQDDNTTYRYRADNSEAEHSGPFIAETI